MVKGKLIISIFLVSLFFLSTASAQEARYNFGSMQAEKSFSVKPGQEITTKLYFYNLYGNRATHIKLNVIEKPENWQVELNPEIRSVDYDVAGVRATVEENLYVELSNTSEKPGQNTDKIEFISSKVGYIGANFVVLKIKVPENEKIGKTEKIKINAIAFWLGQTGSIALQQERDFEYSVTTTTEYYEKPVEKPEEIKEKLPEEGGGEQSGVARITGAVIGTNLSAGILAVTSFILVIVILFLLVRIKRIRNEKSKAK